MKSITPFRGMMPIMPTAITEEGALDEASQRRVVEYCLQCGAAAIGHFGFASECYKVTDAQRSRLIEVIVSTVDGRVPVFIGASAAAVHMAVDYAKEAEALGADLIMATLPHIDVPGVDGAFAYYQALSDAVSLPIIIQDAGHSASVLSAEVLLRMFDEIEHVAHIKAEGPDFLAKTHALIEGAGGRLPVIGGAAGRHMIHMLHMGVTAFMTGTEAQDLHAAVVRAYLNGDEDEATHLYYGKVLPYLSLYMDLEGAPFKEMLHRRGILDCPKFIPPSGKRSLSDVERREFEWVLNYIDFNQTWPDIR